MDHVDQTSEDITHRHEPTSESRLTREIGEWLDASKKDLLNLCPRKFYYRHELGLVPHGTGELIDFVNAMQYGTAIHAALASLYEGTGHDLVTCPCPDFEGCEFCRGQPIPRFAALFLLHYPQDPNPDTRDARTRARGIELLSTYLEKYQREHFTVVAVEVPFEVPFHDLEGAILFTYVGRIDLLVREGKRLVVWDHKTTSRFGEMFQIQFKLSGAITGYCYAVNENLELGEDCHEGTINALRITTRIDKDESFMRPSTQRTPEDFDEWRLEVREAFERIQRYRRERFWPKAAPFACSAYNRVCEYYALCTAGSEQTRRDIVASGFEVKAWDPTQGT